VANTYTIPFSNSPEQFSITLSGTDYFIKNQWNDIAQLWFIDILDADENPLVCSIPLVSGVDLLDGLSYLGIPGVLNCYTNGDPYANPTYDNLGVNSFVYYTTEVDGT
jgi:hypothetical protein